MFVLFAAVLLFAAYLLWRYWAALTATTPEEERFEERIAALNERQAHRYSDEELAAPVTEEDAWRAMVERGRRATRRERATSDLMRRRARKRLPEQTPRLLPGRRVTTLPPDEE
ncbi:hypothetical protein [Roseiflexus castenholzii]|uniref:hypothetical protein n=1 Tax=Roseiflexus castenholzii TaxID=120962 RepID=UPI0023559636